VGVVLLAATNRPEILDPALLRAGRFDRQILIDRPDKAGRAAILRVHMKKARIAQTVRPEDVAALTTGFTGADLANLVNEAALVATRRGAAAVEMEDFTRAIERIIAGLEKKKRLMNPRERAFVAVHESGHALVALALPGTDAVHKVSIIPRGVGALGYTIQRPAEDRYLATQGELENRIAVLLAGRAAEKLVHGHYSTGAADDLAKATDMARAMVARYGMDDHLGHVAYDTDKPTFLGVPDERAAARGEQPSEAIREKLDAAVAGILDRNFDRAAAILTERRAMLDRMAEALLKQETLEEADLKRLTEGLRPLDRPGEAAAE
jgi:cell division protease FtsH